MSVRVRKGAERFPVSVVSKCCVNNTILADAATAAAAADAADAVTCHIPGIASAVTVSAAAVSSAAASAASVSAAGADAFAL